jgi:hypothetical protein
MVEALVAPAAGRRREPTKEKLRQKRSPRHSLVEPDANLTDL